MAVPPTIVSGHSVYNTQAHRAKVVSSDEQSLHQELEYINMALQNCHFPKWALNKLQQKFQCKQHNHNETNSTDQQNSNITNSNGTNLNNNKNIYMVVPYIQVLGENLKGPVTRRASKYISKGPIPSRIYLWPLRTRTPKLQKSGVIYQYKCPTTNCPVEYIGETCRVFGDRFKKHLKVPSPIYLHTSSTGHPVSPDCFNIVHRETQGTARHIKEAMYIRANYPSLNRNLGKYQLTHVWDKILQGSPGLMLK